MQPDQPVYEEMVRRGSRGRWFWLAGTRLRLGGLAGVILVLVLWPVTLYYRPGDVGVLFAALLMLMLAVFALGSFLKKISLWIAGAEGLDAAAILGKAAAAEVRGGEDGEQGR